MNEEIIRLKVYAPEAFSEEINQFAEQYQDDSVIVVTMTDTDSKSKELGFAPVTMTPFILLGIEIRWSA